MSDEIRQRIDTGNWVIMAPERLKGKKLISKNDLLCNVSDYEYKCPFCPGNENRYENVEIDRINKPGTEEWTVKCIENKYTITWHPFSKLMHMFWFVPIINTLPTKNNIKICINKIRIFLV